MYFTLAVIDKETEDGSTSERGLLELLLNTTHYVCVVQYLRQYEVTKDIHPKDRNYRPKMEKVYAHTLLNLEDKESGGLDSVPSLVTHIHLYLVWKSRGDHQIIESERGFMPLNHGTLCLDVSSLSTSRTGKAVTTLSLHVL